jgi:hypothetical protein
LAAQRNSGWHFAAKIDAPRRKRQLILSAFLNEPSKLSHGRVRFIQQQETHILQKRQKFDFVFSASWKNLAPKVVRDSENLFTFRRGTNLIKCQQSQKQIAQALYATNSTLTETSFLKK